MKANAPNSPVAPRCHIVCDECGHTFDGNPKDYHNAPCPKCGEGVLINDEDLAVWHDLMDLSAVLAGMGVLVPAGTPVPAGAVSVTMKISTAPLRNKNGGGDESTS